MSETTPGETPVERRLRILARVSDLPDVDAGREALALLRRVRALRGMRESAWVKWAQETDALLARCEETR